MQKAGIWTLLAVSVVGVAALIAVFFRPAKTVKPLVGQLAPEISLETLARNTARATQDGNTLINFWATWCTPCLAEHPYLVDMADNGMNIVGVAYRDNPARIKTYLSEAGDPFSTLYLDPTGKALDAYGVDGVPESFLIDEDGIVLARVSGALVPKTLDANTQALLEN